MSLEAVSSLDSSRETEESSEWFTLPPARIESERLTKLLMICNFFQPTWNHENQ